ncbi:lysoplasmalogenase [Hanstruepera marina]|uniref:lysoplasmalogenase n=1 Tax=Hanstruepera marina TaxID=2873265 RepID=UPI001CA6BA8E|nr:lysoplasmalogenase [Hanstruepera marina]
MLTKIEKLFTAFFCILLCFEMITAELHSFWHYFAKPSLLIALLVFYYTRSKSIPVPLKRLTLGALLFSLLGDIALMFVDQSAHYFTAGLASFLIAHILYIFVFLKARNRSKSPWLLASILLVYGTGLFWLLNDNLGPMLLPVFLYMLVILTMATTAFLREGRVPKISFYLVFFGAILFLISDSLLAVNKFYTPLAFSNISIMFTYASAQLFIVFGLIKQQ